MRIDFVGADLEENLGLAILSAVVEEGGHVPRIHAFNRADAADALVERIVSEAPDVVGLSIQFQHRAQEFLALARKLRAAGYHGHITAGGQFPTLAFHETLDARHGIDSVVLYDGEQTLPELLDAIERGDEIADVAGLAIRDDDGTPKRSAARALLSDLDAVPFAKRYRAHNRHMGVPFIPIMGSRGCWGNCSYCSIVAFYDDARAHGGGKRVRMRSPDNIAGEMALLWHRAGGSGIFCFHDDNFILPKPTATLERMRAIRAQLDDYGVGKLAIVGKARPDTLTPELARELAALGVIRLYVGVENASDAGGDHLQRGTQQKAVHEALTACQEAGIFVCYNLLIFEPKATLEDVKHNVEFIRTHATQPINFCRAEPYYGTILHKTLSQQQDLGGSFLGYNYRIEDDRTELLFRICAAAFRERNFAPDGVANRYMGLGYAAKVLEHFHDGRRVRALMRRAKELTRQISLDTASYLERAIGLAERADPQDWDSIERKTALLGLEIAAADSHWHREIDELYADMEAVAREDSTPPPPPEPNEKLLRLRRTAMVGLSLAAVAWSGCEGSTVVDPAPPDGGSAGSMVVDPAPGGMGGEAGGGGEAGVGGAGGDGGGFGGFVVDPAPGGMGGMSAVERERDTTLAQSTPRRLELIDQWDDSSPKDTVRTCDLPLFEPPTARLELQRRGDEVLVRLRGVPGAVTSRWEADGTIVRQEDPREVVWRPDRDRARIRAAVRSVGGIAIVSAKS